MSLSTSEGNIMSGLQNEKVVFRGCNILELSFNSTRLLARSWLFWIQRLPDSVRFGSFFGGSEEFWTGSSLYRVYWASNSFWHAIKTWSWFKFKRYLQACTTIGRKVSMLQINQWKIIGTELPTESPLEFGLVPPKSHDVCMFTSCLCSSNLSSLFFWQWCWFPQVPEMTIDSAIADLTTDNFRISGEAVSGRESWVTREDMSNQ